MSMKLARPTIIDEGPTLRLSVRVETCEGHHPSELWFRYPARMREAVSERGDGPLTCLLLAAMARGEDIHVAAAVSPRLLNGLQSYQRLIHSWWPQFRPVSIRADELTEPESGGSATAGALLRGTR
jgi:hypothetical protein